VSPPSRQLPVPERALAVGAHPDDIEFGAGATLARWAAAGCEVSFAICTDGSKGTWDPDDDVDALVAARDPHFFREHGLPPYRPGGLLLFEADEPDHAEVADEPWLAAKVAALEAHESQLESTMFITAEDAGAERARFHHRIRSEMEEAATWADLAGLAERFKLLPTDR